MSMCNLTLCKTDVFQVLDALESRAVAWEYTARYLRGETGPDDEIMIIEECSDPREADEIARHFRDIIGVINGQLA